MERPELHGNELRNQGFEPGDMIYFWGKNRRAASGGGDESPQLSGNPGS